MGSPAISASVSTISRASCRILGETGTNPYFTVMLIRSFRILSFSVPGVVAVNLMPRALTRLPQLSLSTVPAPPSENFPVFDLGSRLRTPPQFGASSSQFRGRTPFNIADWPTFRVTLCRNGKSAVSAGSTMNSSENNANAEAGNFLNDMV